MRKGMHDVACVLYYQFHCERRGGTNLGGEATDSSRLHHGPKPTLKFMNTPARPWRRQPDDDEEFATTPSAAGGDDLDNFAETSRLENTPRPVKPPADFNTPGKWLLHLLSPVPYLFVAAVLPLNVFCLRPWPQYNTLLLIGHCFSSINRGKEPRKPRSVRRRANKSRCCGSIDIQCAQ